MAWHGVPHAALQPSAASLSILVDVQMPLKSEGGRRMGNWMKGGERKGEAEGSSVGGRTANNKSLRASERRVAHTKVNNFIVVVVDSSRPYAAERKRVSYVHSVGHSVQQITNKSNKSGENQLAIPTEPPRSFTHGEELSIVPL